MLTTAATNGLKDYVKRTVAYAQYRIGSTWYRASSLNIFVDSAGKVTIDFSIDPAISGTVTVTQVQLYNTSGILWLDKAEGITRKSTQEGIFYRFTIEIREV